MAKVIGPKRLVIVGATGMVGGYALRYALEHPAVVHIMAIGRRTLGISHPRLKEVLHKDFADCSALAEARMVDIAIRDTSEQRSSVFENRDIQVMVASAEVSA